ncbi:unnamed protein product, partial [Laminaria digitata]
EEYDNDEEDRGMTKQQEEEEEEEEEEDNQKMDGGEEGEYQRMERGGEGDTAEEEEDETVVEEEETNPADRKEEEGDRVVESRDDAHVKEEREEEDKTHVPETQTRPSSSRDGECEGQDEGEDEDEGDEGGVPTRIGDYHVECLLGDGAYGWVYRCRRPTEQGEDTGHCVSQGTTGKDSVVAIKQFKSLGDMEDEDTRNYVRLTQEREADLALSLLHPNIVRCLGTLPAGAGAGGGGVDRGGGGVAFLIFEHVPGTLLDLIQDRPGGLSMTEAIHLLRQLLSAVGFLHQNGVIHRDVKPENILVDTRNEGAPLCDLGTARKAKEKNTSHFSVGAAAPAGATASSLADGAPSETRRLTEYVGSRWYRAPEMLAGSMAYGEGVDVWACACLAVEMCSGRPLFPGQDEGELASSMAALLGPVPPIIASRLRGMGYTPPPPRGSPIRDLEGCLDGSTGRRE